MIVLVTASSGCHYVTYYYVSDYGGSLTISLAPEAAGGTGITVDQTILGLTLEQLDQRIDDDHTGRLDSFAYFPWATDGQTGEPVRGGPVAFVASLPFDSTEACDSPGVFTLELDGAGRLWFDLDPVSNAVQGDQITINESDIGDGLLPTDTLSWTVPVHGDCLGQDAVPHALDLEWSFPDHDEREVRVRSPNTFFLGI